MANLTGNYETDEKAGALVLYRVATGQAIFKGALVAVSDATGNLVRAGDTAGLTFAGVAYEAVSPAAGNDTARVKKTGSFAFPFAGGAPDQTAVGKKAFAVDDNTVALAAATTNDLYVGDIVGIEPGGKVRVRVDAATR